ncbi:MAG: hypothetical protein DCC57_07975 [Chloroflexi bacterium]|nr:MAG: hypothetical protein DCC57_07975 [Chloroflexota bacterium]
MEIFALSLDRAVRDAPGWYQGDFHCHTHHSDGTLAAAELARLARAEGMDFLAITDHNTLDAYAHFGAPEGLCVIPGLEVTFDRGHYNVFGIVQDADWLGPVRRGPTQLHWAKQGLDLNDLLAASAADGLLNSINHPLLPPWAWLFEDAELAHVHCLEIWNDPSWPDNRMGNPLALALWTDWLSAGYRITAIGGSDFHRPVNKPGVRKPPDRLGLPRTFVYAEQLAGQVYPIGAEVGAVDGDLVLEATVTPAGRGGVARLIGNGAILAEQTLPWAASPHATHVLHHTARLAPDAPVWFRLEVLDGNGLLAAVTNPIFAGPRPAPVLTRYGDFVDVTQPALRAR